MKFVTTIQSSVVFYGVLKGLGKSVDLISPVDLQAVEKVGHLATAMYSHGPDPSRPLTLVIFYSFFPPTFPNAQSCSYSFV